MAEELDFVMVMSVNPGYSGQAFIASVLPKIAKIRSLVGDRPLWIGIDGGISASTAAAAVAAGADTLVAATAVFNSAEGIEASIRRLRAAGA